MNHHNGPEKAKASVRPMAHSSFVLPTLAVAGALCGLAGFIIALKSRPPLEIAFLSITGTAQLFLLGVDQLQLVNWPLRIASLLAPAATATVVWKVFATTIHRWWLRTLHNYQPPGVVFLGGGNVAQNIVESGNACIAGRRVVVDLESVAQLPGWSGNLSRFSFLLGSALDRNTLLTAGAHRAKQVWIATGNDRRNLEVLQTLHELDFEFSTRKSININRDWFVDITDRDLLRYVIQLENKWRSEPAFAKIDTHPVSLERMTAREIMKDCLHSTGDSVTESPASRIWESLREGSGFHFAIVGGGVQAEEILLHAIHFLIVDESPNQAPRISWFGSGVGERLRQLHLSFPILKVQENPAADFAEILPVAKIEAFDTSPSSVSLDQWQQAQQGQPFNGVIIAPNGDVSENSRLRETIVQLAAREQDSSGTVVPLIFLKDRTTDLTFGENQAGVYKPEPLKALWKENEKYPGQGYDEEAKLVHAEYLEKDDAPSEVINELWEKAKEYERWSSRYAADHRQIHRTLARRGKDAETLARIEHRRYVVERLLEGWLPTVGQKRQSLRLHPDLAPWNHDLDESSKLKTRGTVEKILRI